MKKIHTVYIAGLFILILGIGATWVIKKADQAHQTPPPTHSTNRQTLKIIQILPL